MDREQLVSKQETDSDNSFVFPQLTLQRGALRCHRCAAALGQSSLDGHLSEDNRGQAQEEELLHSTAAEKTQAFLTHFWYTLEVKAATLLQRSDVKDLVLSPTILLNNIFKA